MDLNLRINRRKRYVGVSREWGGRGGGKEGERDGKREKEEGSGLWIWDGKVSCNWWVCF